MKKILLSFLAFPFTLCLHAQLDHDSVTISRFVERRASDGQGWSKLDRGGYAADLVDERTIWTSTVNIDSLPYIFSLTNRIRENGAKSLGRCFIPRHSINFYKSGKITRYVLVCFQCNGMEFTDMPLEHAGLLISVDVRMQQMAELKILFKDLL